MYYIACIVASLLLSFGSSAQEFAAEPAIASAAVILKLALPTHASRLTILSADRATWREGEAEIAVVERKGRCAFEIKPSGASGLRIDFNRLSVPIQHACGRETCGVRLSGIERAVCVTFTAETEQCRGFVQLGPLPIETARELLASIALLHQKPGCEPLNRR